MKHKAWQLPGLTMSALRQKRTHAVRRSPDRLYALNDETDHGHKSRDGMSTETR